MKTRPLKETVTIFDEEYEISFNYYPGEKDVYYLKNGDPGYPGSNPEIEVLGIEDMYGNAIDESVISNEQAEEQLWDDIDNILDKHFRP